MRILLANEARQGGGGVETYLASLVPALEARGHDVALLYANPAAESGPTSIGASQSWSVEDLGLDRALEGARDWRPDVCFSHNMRLLEVDDRLAGGWPTIKMMHGYFGTCVSGHKAFSFPSVEPCTRLCGPACLVHYVPRHCGRLRGGSILSRYHWAMQQQRLFARYARIVVASEHMKREYLRYGIAADRLHAIPLFVSDTRSPAPDTRRPIDVLFLGRMTALKGADVLLRAARRAAAGRRLQVVVAGEGPLRDRLAAEGRALARAGIADVEFPGWVDAGTRAGLLSRTALVAVPSVWPEPFGLVGLEAAQVGVPAVAFDTGGIREWLTHDVNGRLVDLDAGAAGLGDAIAAILASPSLRERLSAGARAAAARFSAKAHVTALEKVLIASSTN